MANNTEDVAISANEYARMGDAKISANNVWIGKNHNGKWYGWDEMAEMNGNDAEDGYRLLNYESAMVEADDFNDLNRQMNERSYLGYAEYGWDFDGVLPKDGTPIKFTGGNNENTN